MIGKSFLGSMAAELSSHQELCQPKTKKIYYTQKRWITLSLKYVLSAVNQNQNRKTKGHLQTGATLEKSTNSFFKIKLFSGIGFRDVCIKLTESSTV